MESDNISRILFLWFCTNISYCRGQTRPTTGALNVFAGIHHSRCSANPCLTRRCFNGGICYTIRSNCSAKCDCPVSFTGEYCLIPRRADFNSNLHQDRPKNGDRQRSSSPPSGNNNEQGRESPSPSPMGKVAPRYYNENCTFMPCLHGVCKLARLRSLNNMTVHYCNCDKHWTGLNCDQYCDLGCQNGGMCELNPQTKEMVCNCVLGYTGRLCEAMTIDAFFQDNTKKKESSTCKEADDFFSPTKAKWMWYIMGMTSAIFMVIAAVSCVALYRSCKKGHQKHPVPPSTIGSVGTLSSFQPRSLSDNSTHTLNRGLWK